MSPFTVTDETKQMVQQNIAFLLNNFLRCSEYENVIFCWVMHMQEIIDELAARLTLDGAKMRVFTLIADEDALRSRIGRDVEAGIRQPDVISRSLSYLPKYAAIDSVKVNVSHISAAQAAEAIANCVQQHIHPWRITKYDPAYRENGIHYCRDEWTGEADIGNGILTRAEYEATLDRYARCLTQICLADGMQPVISDLENPSGAPWRNGPCTMEQLPDLIRDCLREKCWCRITDGPRYIHFGWDLYSYVGCRTAPDEVAAIARRCGLFAEPMISPYSIADDD